MARNSMLYNRELYPTLTEARAAYKEWADGCTKLHWCLIPFDEWLYSVDREGDMERELAALENDNG